MFIWTGLVFDEKNEDNIRNVCREINKEYDLSELSFTLPQHISIKTSFITDNYIEVKEYIKEILKNQKRFNIRIIGITKINNGVIWLDIEETEELRNVHNLLNTKLKEKYNIPLSGFDGEKFHFHSTLFQDKNIADKHQTLVDKLNYELNLPMTLTINEINLGISEIGKVGTFKVIDSFSFEHFYSH